jgi:hypothetical protein
MEGNGMDVERLWGMDFFLLSHILVSLGCWAKRLIGVLFISGENELEWLGWLFQRRRSIWLDRLQ